MSSKVKCTCGWSWNKSDSSKKDMYVCHQCGKDNTMKDGGWLSKYNSPEAQNGIEGTMAGLTDQGFNYNGAWGGTMAMGGSLPGSVGFTYARTQDPAPSNGKYAKKTKASAQNGQEMKFYQEGLDWKPKNISKDGSVIEDDRGQWAHPGEITKINSNRITMQGVNYPIVGISDTGDTQMMLPNQEYQFDGESVTEYPMMQDGGLMSYREPILNAKDRFVQKQMNKFGDAKFVNRALEIAEKQGYDYGADDGGPLDAVRHAAMSASLSKNLKVPKVIGKYAPALDDAIRMGAANLMGLGYELSNFNEGEGFFMDMKNNYIGSDIGVMKNLTDEERAKKIAGMLKYNKLSIDNPKKPKKENGGWLSKYN